MRAVAERIAEVIMGSPRQAGTHTQVHLSLLQVVDIDGVDVGHLERMTEG
jgi:hypothetical protein